MDLTRGRLHNELMNERHMGNWEVEYKKFSKTVRDILHTLLTFMFYFMVLFQDAVNW